MMNIFEIAIQMEIEGASYYTKMAAQAEDEGLKSIFSLLAADEKKHQAIFESLQSDAAIPSDSLSSGKTDMKQILSTFSSEFPQKEKTHLQAYESALEIELKSIEFYSEYLASLEDTREREVLNFIIQEERKHYDLIDTIIVMINRPNSWVEDAEFGQRERY